MWWLLLMTSVLALRDFEPPAPETRTQDTVDEGWLRVRLNHFDASNTDTFNMRYLYNSRFARSNNSDMVVFVGGEWAVSPGWLRAGLAYELAEDIGAGLFYTEHRYYGDTWPTSGLILKKNEIECIQQSYLSAITNGKPLKLATITGDVIKLTSTSVAELRHLNVDQALGDLAQFIQFVKSDDFEQGRYKYGKVALVGCSYAGTMATWMRLGYPHLVDTAFSDSGPLHAQEDFPEYLDVITKALRTEGSEECVASISDAVERVVDVLTQPGGATLISNTFNTCSQMQASVPLDVATFFWYGITETFAYLVQYATPGDIAAACRVITDATVLDPVQRLANWITSHPWTQPCIETRYAEVVAAHTNSSFSAPATTMRLWTYQTCVEYGWYQTTTGTTHPFLATVPLEYFHQMCRDFFAASFNETLLRAGIARTNHLFAGLTFLPDKVVSVAGGLDPWAPMGPNTNHATPQAPVYVVPGVSHCRAIRPTGENESQILEDTKQAVLQHMLTFLDKQILPESSATGLAPMLLLTVALAFSTLL